MAEEEKQERGRGLKGIDPTIFWVSAIISAILIVWGAIATEHFGGIIDNVFNFLVNNFLSSQVLCNMML